MTRLAQTHCDQAPSGWDRLASLMSEPLRRLVAPPAETCCPLRPVIRHATDARLRCEPEPVEYGIAHAMRVIAAGDLSEHSRVKSIYRVCNRLFDAGSERVVLDLSEADAIDEMIVVSEIGEQWSPKTPPPRTAAR